jgi:Fringe-like.
MYFAVKTCSKYHKDRIPIVKHTWAKHVFHIGFYSDCEGNVYGFIGVSFVGLKVHRENWDRLLA